MIKNKNVKSKNATWEKYFILLGVFLVALTLFACGAANYESMPSESSDMADGSMPAMAPAPAEYSGERANYDSAVTNDSYEKRAEAGTVDVSNGQASESMQRKLIQTINISLVVKEVDSAFKHITEMTKELGGFVQESRQWQGSQAKHGYLTVRIPASKLTQATDEIGTLGKVEDSQTNTQDVTEYYFDREARLRNLERQEMRYLDILDKAESTEDILNVERELVRVREQIEVLQGQLISMDHQVNYSTIHINLEEERIISEVNKPMSISQAFEAAGKAVQNSVNTMLSFLAGVIIFGGYILPLLPVLLIFGYLIWKLRAWRKTKKAKPTEVSQEDNTK